MSKIQNIDSALEQFGLKQFRTGQREVISNVLQGHDCLCVMPTGGGKSLCYQMPAIVRDGLTIVVSPLIALMKDQVDTLKSRGISATLINSSLTAAEQTERLADIMRGVYRLVYIAPERLRNGRFLDAIRATPISLLAIDEAHCISEWGHDFRPDYARLGRFRETLGMVQTIALTATATEKVRQDISSILRLNKPKHFITGFARENLHFGALVCNGDRDKNKELLEFLKQQTGSGIIYAATRKRCEAVLELVRKETANLEIDVYHAGLSNDQRRLIQEQFMKGKLRAIVATNAFGMGIDKSNLRFVVHYNLPGTLEAYYQEAGRAGRDGLKSVCGLLYSSQDRYIQEFFIENANPPEALVRQVYEFLCDQKVDPIELTAEEIRERINCQMSNEAINTAVQIISKTNVIERLDVSGGLAMVRIDSSLPTLVDLLPKEAKVRRKVLRAVEKIVGDRRDEPVYVHPRYLMQHSGLERDSVVRALAELRKLECFDYVPPFRGRAIHFRKSDVPFDELKIDFVALEERKKADYEKLDRVVAFARSTECRQLVILNYFGDPNAKVCGNCDRCQGTVGWPKIDDASVVDAGSVQSANASAPQELTTAQIEFVRQTLQAIDRLHGRLGKILIAEFLVGSETAKVKQLRLNRLPSFALLKQFKKKEVVAILGAMLDTALLVQQEMNANRPTVFIAEPGKAIIDGGDEIPPAVCEAFQFKLSSAATKTVKPERVEPPASKAKTDVPEPLILETKSDDSQPSCSTSVAPSRQIEAEPKSIRSKIDSQDWIWTAKLADRGFMLTEIVAIRRMGIDEVIDDLLSASDAGTTIQCDTLLDRRTQLAVRAFQENQTSAIEPVPITDANHLSKLARLLQKQPT